MELTLEDKNNLVSYSYLTNNRFAYKYDRDNKIPEDEMKIFNFVPTYDKWCLYCDSKDCLLRCSKCKYVFFCNKECQKKVGRFIRIIVIVIYLHYVLLVD